MAWTAPRPWVAAETLTAALLNTHVRDNLLEAAPAKVTTKGDLTVATAANSISRLAVGSNGAVLVADSAAAAGVRWSSTGKTVTGGVLIANNLGATLTAAANNDVIVSFSAGIPVLASVTYTGLTLYGIYNDASAWTKSGTGTITTAYGLYLTAPTIATTNWALYGNDGNYRLGGTSSKVFIGDDANANMTAGLTINQGAGTNEIISFKSSGTAHGITTQTETDTFGFIQQSGGIWVRGFSSGQFGVIIEGNITTENTTKSAAAKAAVMISGQTKSGTSTTTMGANSNLVAFYTGVDTVRFIFDADGDSHEDGTGWTAYDDYDDVALLQALDHSLDKRLNAQAGAWLMENKAALQAARIVTFNDDTDGVPFINKSRLGMLLVGAVRQMAARVDELEGRLLALSA